MTIERDIRSMQWVVRLNRNEIRKAFTSQDEYNALIKEISTLIYETTKEHVYR